MVVSLSETDMRVLDLIQKDLSYSRQELAERAGMSASTLWRKVNELEQGGAIRKRVALLDAEKVGLSVCVFVFVNMADHKRAAREKFEAMVQTAPNILECFSVTGAYDYTLIIRARSVDDYERLLMETILAHPSVANATSQIALRQHKYSTELPL